MNNPQLAPEAVEAAVLAYDEKRREGLNEAPMSERNRQTIAPMIAAAITAYLGSTGVVAPEPIATPELRAKIEAVRAGCEGVTSGPWQVRPYNFDDWGWVRGGPKDDDGRQWLVAIANAGRYVPEDEKAEHRVDGTDPYAANAAHIARLDPGFVRQLCDLATHPAPADTGQGGRVETGDTYRCEIGAVAIVDGMDSPTAAGSYLKLAMVAKNGMRREVTVSLGDAETLASEITGLLEASRAALDAGART